MQRPYVGEITLFAGPYAPRGWAFCDGRLMSVANDAALFLVIGTTFGGNGTTTFAVPNLVERYAMHWGEGPGRVPRELGESGGEVSVTILRDHLGRHNHLPLSAMTADAATPLDTRWATASNRDRTYSSAAADAEMAADLVEPEPPRGFQPHENLSPGIALNYIIALEGEFPNRN